MPTTFQALTIFLFFLPGILGAIVFQRAAEITKPSYLDKIVMAVILALIASTFSQQALNVHFLGLAIPKDATQVVDFGSLIESYAGFDALIRTFVAIIFALLFALIHNKGWVYSIFRKLTSTNQTGAVDPWHEVFTSHQGRWIQIKFKDGKRLVGWPKWYSILSETKEIFVAEATWYSEPDSNGSSNASEVIGPGVLVINFGEILAIEILE